MRFRVRGTENKDEFEIHEMRKIEATTRSFIARAVILTVLCVLVFVAVYAAIAGKSELLTSITSSMTTMSAFVLGHYFKRDG